MLVPLGGKRAFASDRIVQGYAGSAGALLGVCTPYDGGKAVPGNGNMVALQAPGPDVIQAGLRPGAGQRRPRTRSAPGERMPGFYGAYFRDLDGNKVCVFKMG